MNGKLDLDPDTIANCHNAAHSVAKNVLDSISDKTTVSVERTILRLLGIDGIDDNNYPIPNIIVEQLQLKGQLNKGVAYWLGNAMVQTGQDPKDVARLICADELDLTTLPLASEDLINNTMMEFCQTRLAYLTTYHNERHRFRAKFPSIERPYKYVLTATGNVHEDVTHSLAVAANGGDIIAVIRSTAQSLYDFVPYGATTSGFGGTFATQENFRIMRNALDKWAQENNKYMMLSSFCSGLCMPEIAAIGVMEGLDNMVNDAMYGVLYRDINMVRTFIDQRFSRQINGYFGITNNTGEDNYPRTSDAPDTAASIVASELINYYFALNSGLSDPLIGLGNTFELHPDTPNGLLYEWAQALLTRELFPNCPVKYMPPTKHMNGNMYRTQACDTLFNLITIATQQSIQTVGVPSEGIFTPHIHDRVIGLDNTNYVFNAARDLGDEITFKPDGIIQTHAKHVLLQAYDMLVEIEQTGLFIAIENKAFGGISRQVSEGKGLNGVLTVDDSYFNPFDNLMRETAHAQP